MDVPFVMGVGGAIDVIAGLTRRAPVAWQRLGLEWAYRLKQEPRRMFRRYLVGNLRFLSLLVAAKAGQSKRHSPLTRPHPGQATGSRAGPPALAARSHRCQPHRRPSRLTTGRASSRSPAG